MNLANSGRRMSGLHAEAAVELILSKGAANDLTPGSSRSGIIDEKVR